MRGLIFPGSHKSNTGFGALLWLRCGRTERTESKLGGGIEKRGKELKIITISLFILFGIYLVGFV